MNDVKLKSLEMGQRVRLTDEDVRKDVPLIEMSSQELGDAFATLVGWQVVGKDGDYPIVCSMMSPPLDLYDEKGEEVSDKDLSEGVYHLDTGEKCLVTHCGCELAVDNDEGLLGIPHRRNLAMIRTHVIRDGSRWVLDEAR